MSTPLMSGTGGPGAVDTNDPDFAINRIPTCHDLVMSSEHAGFMVESKDLAVLKPALKKRRKRPPTMFHSNDMQASTENYLRFPLTTGDIEDNSVWYYDIRPDSETVQN